MKKVTLTLLIAIFSLFSVISWADGMKFHHKNNSTHKCMKNLTQSRTTNPSNKILEAMHSPMECAKWVESGNPDKDFIANMIPHHEGAILSSEILLKYTHNPRLREIASHIISVQKKEIKEFKKILKNLKNEDSMKKNNPNYDAFKKAAKDDMHDMMHKMTKIHLSDNLDKNFLTAMISHHEGAIKASEQILKITKNARIKKISNKIISAQKKEIQEFKKLIQDL